MCESAWPAAGNSVLSVPSLQPRYAHRQSAVVANGPWFLSLLCSVPEDPHLQHTVTTIRTRTQLHAAEHCFALANSLRETNSLTLLQVFESSWF
jgi:hypothetical protein